MDTRSTLVASHLKNYRKDDISFFVVGIAVGKRRAINMGKCLFGFSKDQPRNDASPFLVGIVVDVADVVTHAIARTIEAIVCSACDVYSIDETILSQGISKVP